MTAFRRFEPDKIKVEWKGVELEGVDVSWTKFVELTPEEERRKNEERMVRVSACRRLWQHTLTTIDIRYPDPTVWIEYVVTEYDTVMEQTLISFRLHNLRDTSDLSKRITMPFLVNCQPTGWPGLQVAQAYITAIWGIFLLHEAHELVTYKNSRKRHYHLEPFRDAHGDRAFMPSGPKAVVDAHEPDSASQIALKRTHDIASTLDWVMGFGRGKQFVFSHESTARRELKNEIDYLNGPKED